MMILNKINIFAKFLQYKSDNLLFKIFFSIGYCGFIGRLVELDKLVISPANVVLVIGASGMLLTFIWTKKLDK